MEFTGERFVPRVEGDIRLEHVHRYLLARRLVRGKRVLDVACGEGYGSDMLAGAAATVVGVDIDEASVEHARKAYTRPNLRFLHGDATAMPLGDASVDVVVSFETIEHLTDHHLLMLEFRRVLAPGGVLVLSSPDRREYSDVPRYKNPYHRRELYLSELKVLLAEHFRRHALYGQRVHYGSVIAPMEGGAVPFVGFRDGAESGVVEGAGLPNPVYFVAVASDDALPELPAGLFIPQVPPYMRDIEFLNTELEAQQRQVAEAALRDASRHEEFDQRGRRMDALAGELRQAEATTEGLRQEIALLQGALASKEAELVALRQNATTLERRRAALLRDATTKASALRQELETMQRQFDDLERRHAAALRLDEAVRASHSWRVTAPLRAISRLVQRLKRLGYVGAALVSRAAYRGLPLPAAAKLRLKHRLFARTGRIFAGTGAYLRWQEMLRGHEGAAAFPLAVTSRSKPTPAGSAPAMPGLLPAWTNAALPAANGRWEWERHGPMRARIAERLAARRGEARFQPRPMIEIGDQDPAEAAAGIALPAPGDAPAVSIIVPVFNELDSTIECLLSIAAAGGETGFEVIIADDASTDRTREVLARVPNLRLVSQAENLGFLRNCNAAAKAARGRRLVLLNNDAQVMPGWLDALSHALDAPGVGAVGGRFVYPSGMLQEAGVRIRREGTVEMIGHGEMPESPRWSYARQVEYVSGACLMLDTALFRELGGFNEDLAPAYCEDLELCLRIRERGLGIVYVPEAEIVHHLSRSSDALGNSDKLGLIARNMQYLSERRRATFDRLDDLRVIAFYLPQFHPVPENDLWWGRGFTEWSNVGKARPNFIGQDQPRTPADLGYYDLRLPEVLEAQEELADRYGIDGFCYYYYWFDGHRLLDRPLERLRDPDSAARPFCLCWANENWTRRWDGQDQEVLIAQRHSPEDDIAVIHDIAGYMRHHAYIRVNGRPLLLIYRPDLFPDFVATAARWRAEVRSLGLGELYLVRVNAFQFAQSTIHPSEQGCDAAVEFPAHNIPGARPVAGTILNPECKSLSADYEDTALHFATHEHPGHTYFRGVMPGWDNTPRRQNDSFCLEGASPGAFQAWLEAAIADTKRDLQGEERLLFVNAWNEWAEGAYLEPDRRFGHAFLQAVRNARDAAWLLRGEG